MINQKAKIGGNGVNNAATRPPIWNSGFKVMGSWPRWTFTRRRTWVMNPFEAVALTEGGDAWAMRSLRRIRWPVFLPLAAPPHHLSVGEREEPFVADEKQVGTGPAVLGKRNDPQEQIDQ